MNREWVELMMVHWLEKQALIRARGQGKDNRSICSDPRFPRIISLPCAGRLKAKIIPYLLTLLVIHFMLSKFSVKNQILIFFPSLCFRNRLYRRGRADRETLAKYNQNWACRKIFPILWKMCTTITQSFVRDLSSRFP